MLSYKHMHMDISDTISADDDLRHKYFKICYEFIISNIFDEDYIIKLIDSNFLESILNCNNKIKKIYDFCEKYKSKMNKKCTNCKNYLEQPDICNICGEETTFQQFSSLVEQHFKNFYSNVRNQRVKHDPNKHCEIWLLQLQGKENVNITTENFNKIIRVAKEWYKHNSNVELSCEIIRKWLKTLSLTAYNPHVTWLRIQIYFECDTKSYLNRNYDLSNNELIKILEYFNKITAEYSSLLKEPKFLQMLQKKTICNILYYPYFIAKILPFVIDDKDRLSTLLSNIHFLNKITLAKNEYIWKEICTRLNYIYTSLSSV